MIQPTKLCRYQTPPGRQLMSHAGVTVKYPIQRLMNRFVSWFLGEGLGQLERGTGRKITAQFLEDWNLGPAELRMEKFAAAIPTWVPRWDGTLKKLTGLQANADNALDSDGSWRDEFQSQLPSADKVAAKLSNAMEQALAELLRHAGPEPAREFLQTTRLHLEQQRDLVESELAGRGSDPDLFVIPDALADRLADEKAAVRKCGEFRSLGKRLWLWFRPKTSIERWLPQLQRTKITRFAKTLTEVLEIRFRQSFAEWKLAIYRQLLGTGKSGGPMDGLFAHLEEHRNVSRQLVSRLADPWETLSANHAGVLLFVSSLGDVLDPVQGRRLVDFYADLTSQAQISPAQWAAEVHEHGISIRDQCYRPDRWIELEPAELLEVLQNSVRQMLGVDAPLNLSAPRSPAELIACRGMHDAAFRPVLEQLIPKIKERLGVPLSVWELADVTSHAPDLFLHCPSADRAAWQVHFHGDFKIQDDEHQSVYDVGHPFEVQFLTHNKGIPAGGVEQLHRWLRVTNQNRTRNEVPPPLTDWQQGVEIRCLDRRVHDNTDCEQLLAAGIDCHQILPVDDAKARWKLAQADSRVAHLFAPWKCEPKWLSASEFHNQLRNSESGFVDFLEREFPEQSDLKQRCLHWQGETDSQAVAADLVTRGILEDSSSGQYRLRVTPSDRNLIVSGLFHVKLGAVRGLTRDEFIAHLMDHDDLYNQLFWRVLDAYQQGRLNRNDLPTFLLELDSRLG
ncbi:MAG: hypothetical protein KDA84_15340 [Planctomycetaceae bacterium]|nr:hypothetical protein [Planctomycetaceae bacterium]